MGFLCERFICWQPPLRFVVSCRGTVYVPQMGMTVPLPMEDCLYGSRGKVSYAQKRSGADADAGGQGCPPLRSAACCRRRSGWCIARSGEEIYKERLVGAPCFVIAVCAQLFAAGLGLVKLAIERSDHLFDGYDGFRAVGVLPRESEPVLEIPSFRIHKRQRIQYGLSLYSHVVMQ